MGLSRAFYLKSCSTCFLTLCNQPGRAFEWHGFNKSLWTMILFLEDNWTWARTLLCIFVMKQAPFHLGWNLGVTLFLRSSFAYHTTSLAFIGSPNVEWLYSRVCFSAVLLSITGPFHKQTGSVLQFLHILFCCVLLPVGRDSMTSTGMLNSRPYIIKFGVKPVDSCGVNLYAIAMKGKWAAI